eukprot:scaffold4750_cov140-Isochrysis_galbana.AAC.7
MVLLGASARSGNPRARLRSLCLRLPAPLPPQLLFSHVLTHVAVSLKFAQQACLCLLEQFECPWSVWVFRFVWMAVQRALPEGTVHVVAAAVPCGFTDEVRVWLGQV